jgi:type I restriction enzyme, R subunit
MAHWSRAASSLSLMYTIRNKISENVLVMKQIANNSTEQAMFGDFTKAFDDAIMVVMKPITKRSCSCYPAKAAGFAKACLIC